MFAVLLGLLLWVAVFACCYVFVLVGSSGHTDGIAPRVSKGDLDFNAKLAARRHAELHGGSR